MAADSVKAAKIRDVDDPDLHLLAAGRRINPIMRDGCAVFALELPCADLVLASRAERPLDMGFNADGRLLGFRLTELALDQQGRRRVLALGHPALVEGLHPMEANGTRWTDGGAVLAPALFGDAAGPALLSVAGIGLPRYRLRDGAAKALMARFESLGDNCEFALVQRHFQAEPVSLLRWAGTDAARLVLGLCRRFDGLGDPARTVLEWRPETQEYFLQDERYLGCHTWQGARLDDPAAEEAMRLAGCARLRLLRRKLLSDIAAGQRIMVYKSHRDDLLPGHMAAIREALRGIGPAPLLFVARAEGADQVGQVQALGDLVYRGWIDSFSRADTSFAAWHRICAATATLVDAEQPK